MYVLTNFFGLEFLSLNKDCCTWPSSDETAGHEAPDIHPLFPCTLAIYKKEKEPLDYILTLFGGCANPWDFHICSLPTHSVFSNHAELSGLNK